MQSARALCIASVLAIAVAACGSKDDDAGKGKAANKGSTNSDPNVLASSAEAFYKDWTGTKGAALMKKYEGKTIEVTGTVSHVIKGGEHVEYTVYVIAGANKLVAKFKDMGKAAAAKNVAKGSTVTINCTPAGMIGKSASINDCVLK